MKTPTRFRNPRSTVQLFVLIIAVSIAGAMSQTIWNGNGDGLSWTDSANWSNGLPDPEKQTRFLGSSFDGDNPLSVTVASPQTLGTMNFANTDNQTLTISGSALRLQAANTVTWNTSFGGERAPIIVNSNVEYFNAEADTAATFNIGVANAITFNGDITTSGTGARQMTISGSAVVTINGNNQASFFSFGGSGEVVAGSSTALGGGAVQKTTSSMLSLRSDVTVTGTGSSYSWLGGSNLTQIRISETAPSSTDRTLTFESRTSGTGGFQFVENVNSTGNLILEHKYDGGNAQNMPLATNDTAVIRFAQAGTTTYSGPISGTGRVEVTEGGETTFTAENTYTGTTTVTNGTLLLSGDGSIENTSEINLASGTTFDISGITPADYTIGTDQILSGEGTVLGGGKELIIEGILDPGNSPGTLTFDMDETGVLSLGSDVELRFELGTLSDLVALTEGTLDIGDETLGFDNFDFTALASFGAGEYTLFQTPETIQGTLGAVTSGTIGGMSGTLGIQGTDLVLTMIPEPGTTSLLLLVTVGALAGIARKRKA